MFFQAIDPKIQHLAATWHSFDLDKIDAKTRDGSGNPQSEAPRDPISAQEDDREANELAPAVT